MTFFFYSHFSSIYLLILLKYFFTSITIIYIFFFVFASVVLLINKLTIFFLFSIFNNVSRFNYENQRNSKLLFHIYLFKKYSYLYQWQILNNFICQIGNWSIRFSAFSFSFIFFFFLVYNYYRLRYQSIYKHMKRGFLRRTFEYRWKKRKKKKWCMYWFPLYRCFGTASWTNALHICSFRIHLETRSMKFFKRLSMFWT